MPAILRHPRPPLPRFAVAWFPAFEGIAAIEAFRRKHDPMAPHVPAHLTLVFPFPTALSPLQVRTHVRQVASHWPPIAVSFRAARLHANEFVFLMAARGAASVSALHDRLYTRSLAPHLRRDLPYEPHLTLARHADPGRLETALDEARELLPGEALDVMRSVTLLALRQDGRMDRLDEIDLHTA